MTFDELPNDSKVLLGYLFDPESPTSLFHLLPYTYYQQLFDMVVQAPDLHRLLQDEDDLKSALKTGYSYHPTVSDHRLRYSFWYEAESALMENRKMVMNRVHSLVCSESAFRILFLKMPYRTCFLMCRPLAHEQTLREMLLHGLGRMRNILDLPEVDAKGRVNTKILELKLKITHMMDMRLHGSPTQKIHQITQNLPAITTGTKKTVQQLVQKADMNTIQKRIEEIEAEKRRLEGRGKEAPMEAEMVVVGEKKI